MSKVVNDLVLPDPAEYNVALADRITVLEAREKDLTLEGLALIGKVEQRDEALARIRGVLAGTDAGALPHDYPTERMAQDRMDRINALEAEVERLRKMAEDHFGDEVAAAIRALIPGTTPPPT